MTTTDDDMLTNLAACARQAWTIQERETGMVSDEENTEKRAEQIACLQAAAAQTLQIILPESVITVDGDMVTFTVDGLPLTYGTNHALLPMVYCDECDWQWPAHGAVIRDLADLGYWLERFHAEQPLPHTCPAPIPPPAWRVLRRGFVTSTGDVLAFQHCTPQWLKGGLVIWMPYSFVDEHGALVEFEQEEEAQAFLEAYIAWLDRES